MRVGLAAIHGRTSVFWEGNKFVAMDSTAWTVVFNSTPAAFHLRYPSGSDVLRVQATPQQGQHVETLMFAFPSVDGDSAILHLHWGTTIVPLTLRVAPDATR